MHLGRHRIAKLPEKPKLVISLLEIKEHQPKLLDCLKGLRCPPFILGWSDPSKVGWGLSSGILIRSR